LSWSIANQISRIPKANLNYPSGSYELEIVEAASDAANFMTVLTVEAR
jgi:hypothetical protein